MLISNCNIKCTDDAIALKAMEPGQPVSDVVVANCMLSTWCAAIRVGPDAICDIERVTVSNCIIRDTGMNGIKIQQAMGAAMRIYFANIVMDRVNGPISIGLSGWKTGANVWATFDDSRWEQGEISGIRFSNIRANAVRDAARKLAMSITGAGKARPRDIVFSDVEVTFPGGGTLEDAQRRDVPELERQYPGVLTYSERCPATGFMFAMPMISFCTTCDLVTQTPDLRPAIVCDDVRELEATLFQRTTKPASGIADPFAGG